MMMGTAGELPKPPEKPTQFLEDMTDAQVAEAVRMDEWIDQRRAHTDTLYNNSSISLLVWRILATLAT